MRASGPRRHHRVACWTSVYVIGLLALLVTPMASMPALAEGAPAGGGIDPNHLWINARLGQPQGPSVRGPSTGRALRYIRLGQLPGCTPAIFQGTGIDQWFGTGGDPTVDTERVEVVSVDRANPSDQIPLGLGCVNGNVLVQVPTAEEVLNIFRSQYIPKPVVRLSPGQGGLTGLETWYWYSGGANVSVGFGAGGFAITAEASAANFRWSTGDGSVLTSSKAGSPGAPAASHVYRTKNAGYPVSLSMVWTGRYTWSGFGDSGSGPLGPVTVTGETHPYPVAEVRSVLE
jgi:hypothetical protein